MMPQKFNRTIYPHSSKKPIYEMNNQQFTDYFKQMKKDLRRVYYLSMKQFIYSKDRNDDPEMEQTYKKVLESYLLDYYTSKVKELDNKLSKFRY